MRASPVVRSAHSRFAPAHQPGLLARLFRIVWVLTLTFGSLIGAILWQAEQSHCVAPCRLDASHAAVGMRPVAR
jgi:hypothetical protein